LTPSKWWIVAKVSPIHTRNQSCAARNWFVWSPSKANQSRLTFSVTITANKLWKQFRLKRWLDDSLRHIWMEEWRLTNHLDTLEVGMRILDAHRFQQQWLWPMIVVALGCLVRLQGGQSFLRLGQSQEPKQS
jgi:hypothetical protein